MSDPNDEFMDRLIELMREPVDPDADRRPCLPIPCPPMEEVSVTWTPVRCPECGVVPYSCHSIFDRLDHELVWTCPTHGVVDVRARSTDDPG